MFIDVAKNETPSKGKMCHKIMLSISNAETVIASTTDPVIEGQCVNVYFIKKHVKYFYNHSTVT